MSTPELFYPFGDLDHPNHGYKLVATTEENIQHVLSVLIECDTLSQNDRIRYARLAGLEPEHFEQEGKTMEKWEFKNTYSAHNYIPALTERLFLACPKLTKKSAGKIVVFDKERLKKLDRGVVLQAFFTWKKRFDLTLSELMSLSLK